jgi:hypothetical protein
MVPTKMTTIAGRMVTMRLRNWLVAGGVGVTMLVGLGAAAIAALPEASGDACKLLTAQQVSAALGVPVDEGQYEMPGHPQFCAWSEHGKPNMTAQNVRVHLMTAQQYELPKAGPFAKGPESGVGDEAYWAYTPGIGYTLSVKKGSVYMRLESRPIPNGMARHSDTPEEKAKWDEKSKEVEKALALNALNKL